MKGLMIIKRKLQQLDVLLRIIENNTDGIDTVTGYLEKEKETSNYLKFCLGDIGSKSEEIFTIAQCARNKINELIEDEYEEED